MDSKLFLSIIIPTYNEEKSIETTIYGISSFLEKKGITQFEIIIVNNASTDNSLSKIITLKHKFPQITIIDLSRNFGNQYSLLAGWQNANGDVGVSLDADGQDPIEVIGDFLDAWKQGSKVVIGKKINKIDDSKIVSIIKSLGVKFLAIENGEADFCLMDKQVIDELKNLGESNIFLREIRKNLGYPTKFIPYTRQKRTGGTSYFSIKKLCKLGMIAFINYGAFPYTVFATFAGSVGIFGMYEVFFNIVNGLLLLCFSITLGLLLFIIKYLSMIHQETRKRKPYYINKIYK